MAISKNDVIRVAHLARIGLNEQEIELFSGQLESILEFVDKLKRLDVSNIKPTSHVLEMQNILRADVPMASLDKEAVLRNAPESANGHFRVPKVIE